MEAVTETPVVETPAETVVETPAEPTPTSPLLGGKEPEKEFTWEALPEKFHVKGEDGTLDKDKTAANLAKSYTEIEKRASRGGEVRPKTAAEYVVNVPEAMKEAITASDPGVMAFLGKAHQAGYTQKQIDLAISTYAELAPSLVKGASALEGDAAVADLRTVWKTPEEFETNLSHAERAISQIGGPELVAATMNRPVLIRAFAAIGAQMREDTPPATLAPAASVDVNTLMSHEAYSNPKHPEHAAISAKVNKFFASQPGADVPV